MRIVDRSSTDASDTAGEAPSIVPVAEGAAASGSLLYCVGLSHRTSPLEVRERLALGFEEAPDVLAELRAQGDVLEAVWLVTCNRVELYAVVPVRGATATQTGAGWVEAFQNRSDQRSRKRSLDRGAGRLLAHFFRRPGQSDKAVFQALYCEEAADGVEHLFRVASGLDSMVLGETEILGQLKEAYELARREGHTGRVLNTVFQGAFRAAKQVRSETGIQRGAVSVASLAVELAEETFGDLAGCRVLVLGAGDTGEKVTRALLDRGVAEVRIVNRSEERGKALAAILGPRARALPEWSGALDEVDVVVGSTSSPGFVLDEKRLSSAMQERRGKPLLLVDLAVPRDFDPAVAGLPGVRLLNIDDLRSLAERHLEQRQVEVLRCEELLRAHVRDVMNRL